MCGIYLAIYIVSVKTLSNSIERYIHFERTSLICDLFTITAVKDSIG